jgi:hypothetical protein
MHTDSLIHFELHRAVHRELLAEAEQHRRTAAARGVGRRAGHRPATLAGSMAPGPEAAAP